MKRSLITMLLVVMSILCLQTCEETGGGELYVIEVTPSAVNMEIDSTQQFTAVGRDVDMNIIPDLTFTWTSRYPNVGLIDENGVLTTLSTGVTMISAKSGSIESVQINVEVYDPIYSITVSPETLTFYNLGETSNLTASGKDINDDDVSGLPLIWESEDTVIATVDEDGLVTAIGGGSTTITVSLRGMESPPVTVFVIPYLFKATFTNDWLSSESGPAIIFLSDLDGNVLSENTWYGNDSFEMFLDEGLTKSVLNDINMISATIVTGDTSRANINTYMNIPVGSSWTFNSFPWVDTDNPNTVELDFQNVPEHDGYVISSDWTSRISHSGSLSLPYNFSFYESPDDIYVKLNTVNNGVQYYWLNDVIGGSRLDDLSNMNTALSQTITLADNNGYRIYLDGSVDPNHRYGARRRLDYVRDYNFANSINVYYPQDSFPDYVTSIYLIEQPYQEEWYQRTFGDIPNSVTKINADFEYISTSMDNFEISATGDYITTRSIWSTEGYSSTADYWYVNSDDEFTKYKLPTLPNSVEQLFNIDRTGFGLWLTDIVDFPELSSYSEYLAIVYDSPDYLYDVINLYKRYTLYAPNNDMLNSSGDSNYGTIRKEYLNDY